MFTKHFFLPKRQIFHEISALLPIQHKHRTFSAVGFGGGVVNVNEVENDYPFVKQFLHKSSDEDVVKWRWPLIDDYCAKCKANPFISKKQFDFIRQRYGMLL